MVTEPAPSPLATPQTASATVRLGDRVVMSAEARATPLGLLAVGGLVAAILLSIPPIIRASVGARSLRRLRSAPEQPTIELIAQRDTIDR